MRKNFSTEEKKLKDKIEREARHVSEIMKKYPSLKEEIEWMRKWQYHRNSTTEDYYSAFQWFRLMFSRAAELLNVTYDDMLTLSVPEIIDALEGKDYTQEIKTRKRKGFTLKYNKGSILYSGVKKKDILDKKPLYSRFLFTIIQISSSFTTFSSTIMSKLRLPTTEIFFPSQR